ncbi:MAG TPA: hypothetical protein VLC98_14630 [Phnomibacter sp.]|nr:hypothetical protein [Phnomibacter sp.]
MNDKYSMSEQESLQLISSMIDKAKNSYHDRGTASILWGTVISICSLVTWAQIYFDHWLGFDIWMLTIAAIIPTVWLSIREKKLRKAKSYDQTAMDAVWMCFGMAIFLTVHASLAAGAAFASLKDTIEHAGMSRPAISFNEYSSSYMLTLYGIPTLVTAAIKNFKPMYIGGIICWLSAIISIYTPVDIDMLLMALSAITAWLIPGIILRSRSKSKTEAQHV